MGKSPPCWWALGCSPSPRSGAARGKPRGKHPESQKAPPQKRDKVNILDTAHALSIVPTNPLPPPLPLSFLSTFRHAEVLLRQAGWKKN